MTENEKIIEEANEIAKGRMYATNEVIRLQKELEQYRAIGTVEEFKALKEKNEQIPIIHGKAELELHDKGIRNKVIDKFAEKFIFKAVCEGCSGCCNCYEEGRQSECEDWKAYMEIAEEMRGAE